MRKDMLELREDMLELVRDMLGWNETCKPVFPPVNTRIVYADVEMYWYMFKFCPVTIRNGYASVHVPSGTVKPDRTSLEHS